MSTNGSMKRTKGNGQQNQDLSLNAADLTRLQNLSALTNRLALARKLGQSHGGDRDLYSTLGYPQEVKSTDLIGLWQRQAMARALVDRPVKKTWQGDVVITEPGDEDETDLEKKFKELNERIELKSRLLRADRLAQLGEYSVLLLGFDDSSEDTWARPVGVEDEGTDIDRELLYVRPISKGNAEVDAYEEDPSNPRFGLPRIYEIDLDRPDDEDVGNKSVDDRTLKVHHSRIIHVAFDLLENEVEGNPIMKAAYNRLKDLEKLVGGSAEMFWRGARPGYTGSAKEDYNLGEDAEKNLKEQLDEYENDLRRFIVSEGIDLSSLEQQISDPEGHVTVQVQMLSAVSGIPVRILIGSERGELASTQDQENFKEFIQTRRTEEAEPNILRPFVDRMIKYGVLPEPQNKEVGYSVVWSNLFTLGEKEKAEVGQNRAEALAKYVKQPLSEEFVPLEAFLKYFLKLDEDTTEQILELRKSELEEMMQEERELERIEREQQEEPEEEES